MALPGFTPRAEEDFYSCGEDVKLRMVFQGSDAEKAASTLERVLCSSSTNGSSSSGDMDVEREHPKSSSKPSLSVRKSHSSSISLSSSGSRVYSSISRTDVQVKRKTSFVTMTVRKGFPEFDPHPQGGMIMSALGEVFVPEVASERLWGSRSNKEDPFNDSYPPTGSSSSSSSSRKRGSTDSESISPIKPRSGEINDKDMLSSLSFSSTPQLYKILMRTDSNSSSSSSSNSKGSNNDSDMQQQQQQQQKRGKKKKKSKEKSLDGTPLKTCSPKKTVATTNKKKKSSPSKVLINSLGARPDIFRRERKRICDIYAKSKAHFILLEKAMKDTLEEFSEIRLLMAKAAKGMQRIHRVCRCQSHF